jgi:hypothetical protein
MDEIGDPGKWSMRSAEEARNDPRRLGNIDALGFVDTREGPEAALALYRAHIEKEAS